MKTELISDDTENGQDSPSVSLDFITEKEISIAQTAWGNGLVKIGEVFTREGYLQAKKEAISFILEHYDFQHDNDVLFKPTLASEEPFRLHFDGALSYFVGGNPNFPEDKGFALTPYINVWWENKATRIIGNMAVAMGHYYFYSTSDDPIKVEYSFGYTKDKEGNLKIILQHSSLPYDPKNE